MICLLYHGISVGWKGLEHLLRGERRTAIKILDRNSMKHSSRRPMRNTPAKSYQLLLDKACEECDHMIYKEATGRA